VTDAVLLRAILANLLSNAWKFTSRHETARIEVGVTDSADGPAFFVRDDGAGFDMEAATRLFGPFQRYHSPEDFAGDGIGLATVQRLVARLGGQAWAEAEVEKGATFSFTLPAPAVGS
jgi:light-regulated signal transduction histidine kinase (bacteriophytochrome)